MHPYEQIKSGFDKNASLYQERFMDLTLYNASYDQFCELIRVPAARILEIGCGPGNITRYLLSAHPDFRITATDIAPNMVTLAKLNNPAANCLVLDAREISVLKGPFDGIICGFCLPYLTPTDCNKLISDSAAMLSAGGIAYFSTIEADAEHQSGYETTSNGEDPFYVWYHTAEELIRSIVQHGMELVSVNRLDYGSDTARPATHLILIARKKEALPA